MTKVEDYNPYRWKEGLICFSDESFPNIMKDFEKYYGVKIVIENKMYCRLILREIQTNRRNRLCASYLTEKYRFPI